MKISKLALSIPESMTLAISAKAKELKASGKSVIGFTAGEPDFDTPELIKDSAKSALDKGFTKYTPASGMPELKNAIVKKLAEDNNLTYKPNQIVVATGGKSALYHALMSIIDPDDEVIIPVPYWLTYPEQVKLCGGVSVFVDTRNDGYKITPESLKKAITLKTKCLILNSPSNPSGVVYSKQELIEIAKIVKETGIYVVSDEIYEKLVYVGEYYSIAQVCDDIKDNVIIVNGMSKSYSMTGWRIGYTASNPEVAKAISNLQSHTTSNACSISQFASVTALNEAKQFTIDAKNIFAARRLLMVEFAKKLPNITIIEPQGAFYLFMNVSAYFGKKVNDTVINGSLDFAKCLLDFGVAVIPGLPFGDDNCVRLSYAVSEKDIVAGFDRISEFLKTIK